MKKKLIFMVLGALCAPVLVHAAAIETVKLTGPFGANEWSDINLAIGSVDNGGVINIIEAGTYLPATTLTAVTLPGGKSFSIIGTVSGVIIGGPTYAAPWQLSGSGGPAGGNVNVTLQNLRIERGTGAGAVIDVDQAAGGGFTTTIVMNSVEVIHSLTATGGEALKIDDGVVGGGGAAISITGTNCIFQSASTSGTAKSAIRVQSDVGPIENFTLNLTGTAISNASAESAIRTDGQNNQTFSFTNCTIAAPSFSGFRTNVNGHNNSSFTFKGTSVTSLNECIMHNVAVACSNNLWDVERCSLDNSGGTLRTLRINYITGGSGNEVRAYNNVIKTNAATGRGIDGAFINTANYHNNTIFGIGSTVTSSIGISMSSSSAYNFSNNLIANVFDPVSGTTGTKTKNFAYGPFALDSSVGADQTYLNVPAGEANTTTPLNLNPTTLKQGLSSALNNAGDASFNATIGNIDRLSFPRSQGGANPDVGAYEVNEITKVGDWQTLQ